MPKALLQPATPTKEYNKSEINFHQNKIIVVNEQPLHASRTLLLEQKLFLISKVVATHVKRAHRLWGYSTLK